MLTLELSRHDDFEGWRQGARHALFEGFAADEVRFVGPEDGPGLFYKYARDREGSRSNRVLKVPRDFIDLGRQVICHSDGERTALLYRLLLRLQENKRLLLQGADRDVHRANVLAKAVRRDAHKMKAFVRFRKTGEADGIEQFVAWFEPSHHIVRYTAPFFQRRFANMLWSILSPKGCAHWDGQELTFSPPVPASQAPAEDALEDYWRSYYASIFNPARLKTAAMQAEMPKKYWRNLPEASLIPGLVAKARERERDMRDEAPTLPRPQMMKHKAAEIEILEERPDAPVSLEHLSEAVGHCRACPLWKPATQAVPGQGPADAPLMIVGEQPGDVEDLRGEPFVGPAGQLLREITAEAGYDLDRAYVTNAVKHFKFAPRGKRRLHQNPSAGEIDHCKWWLAREIELVSPRVILALGGSAVRSLTGRTQTIKSLRGGEHLLTGGSTMIVANHPSYVLRLPQGVAKAEARAALLEDVTRAFQRAA